MELPEIPEKIGKYKIAGEIARGGMGIVYKAVHPTLRRYVIIKKLTIRGNAAVRERFLREAKILLDLHHANIVHLFDYFTEGSFHYIVLEYVDGMSLDKYLQRRHKISIPVALLIFRDTCFALRYAHEHGIVHRDIKPGNILISRHGNIKLADFGIASSEDSEESDLTQAGTTLGTPSYMPPEQFGDSKNVDKRADIYAMGVMLYEMLAGVKPFPGKFSPETIARIQKGKYLPIKSAEKNVPPCIQRLIKKMMQPNPKRRYQNMNQILSVVNRYLKRYETEEVRSALVHGVCSEKFSEPQFTDKSRGIARFSAAAFAVLFLGAGFFAAWHEGIIHKYLLRTWYTPVTLDITVPSSASPDADLPMRAFFFQNDGKDIPELENCRRIFIPREKKSDKPASSKQYRAKSVYLRPGAYRIKIVAGPYVWWQSLSVAKEENLIRLDFLKTARRSLAVNAKAFDSTTKRDISSRTVFSVLHNGAWIPLQNFPAETLMSGNVWKIRAAADGYVSELFSLRIEWYQDELYIAAELSPEKK
ncbi:MAG: serine/threonine protein kinase [Bacteroides sp.]|nr:serine/threonine protein kinase [Prevotella sp.]MCM1407783.1 serine/threonine protein kinase [Treponema brennaborense]MCM1468869.1 serine/threonine protein kinase [Bacteroides sp.]